MIAHGCSICASLGQALFPGLTSDLARMVVFVPIPWNMHDTIEFVARDVRFVGSEVWPV